MECKNQPSPWPCVLMLLVLLLCCLAVPHYWQRETTPNPPLQAQLFRSEFQNRNANVVAINPQANWGPGGNGLAGEWNDLFAPPTIEELVARQSVYDPYRRNTNGAALDWPALAIPSNDPPQPSDVAFPVPTATFVEPDPYITTALQQIGAAIANYLPANATSAVFANLTATVPKYVAAWSNTTPIPGPSFTWQSQLPVIGPGDHVAMLPAPPMKTSWCVPQVLFEQLQRLSEHAYSAQWASHVSNQLHAITEREQLEGEDVRLILADLNDAAQEAVILSDNTNDDPLRVELLRAHWALARRLDCWAAMHEQRVAFISKGRVAARGDLSPYFDSAPDNQPTPTEVQELTRLLETYERSCDSRLAGKIVEQQRLLAASPVAYDRTVAGAVEQHYRNANIRIAITAAMVNRMMENSERSESRPVNDRIAGAYVHGQSEIYAKNNVALAPAEEEWHIKVQTNGVVESNTMASAGPVQFRSQGATDFSGSKSVIVRPDGMHLQPSEVVANSHSRLMGVTTDYDWIPMFGNVTRDRAKEQYRAKQNFVREATETRVSDEASERLDHDTQEAMERVRQRLYVRFTNRFDQYGLKLTTVEMKTTPERIVARVRVATENQLGSHTPRPRALSDSLASIQLHESAMNNLATTLGLDGQRLTGEELQKKIQERFPAMAQAQPEDVRRDIVFQFAPKDAVQVHIADGKLELKINFDSVELDGDTTTNISVHAGYVPQVEGLTADLKRDGALGIEGKIGAGERARLHNIFKTVFPPERKLRIANLKDEDERRLDGLMITQLVLEDGWIGLAIGPESTNRVAERSRSLR